MKPLVSIIIPTYNVGKYIDQTLESIFDQDVTDYEVIVVDDGSTDATQSILEAYKNRISFCYQQNRGPAAARNVGIKMAKGKYIAFQDGDDLWTSGKLKQQVKLMDSYPDVGLLSGDMQRFTGGKTNVPSMFKKYGFDSDFFGDEFYVIDAYKKIYLQGNYIPTGTVILRRKCVETVGYFDEKFRHSEDLDLWLRIAMQYRLAYSNEIWLLRRDHEINLTGDTEKMNLSLIEVLEKHEKQYKSFLIQEGINYNKVISGKYRNTGYLCLIGFKIDIARECLRKSLLRSFQVKTFLYWFASFTGIFFIKTVLKLRRKIGE
ncbi:MAG: glycosyltransferase [Candidatus Brocadiaceae bacterium]|nr:glycosyltransferase [Candidatus Brocadiaceae bacterium]